MDRLFPLICTLALAYLTCVSAGNIKGAVSKVVAKHKITIGKHVVEGGHSLHVKFNGGNWKKFIGGAMWKARVHAQAEATRKAKVVMSRHGINFKQLLKAKRENRAWHYIVRRPAGKKPAPKKNLVHRKRGSAGQMKTSKVVATQMVTVHDKSFLVKETVSMQFNKFNFKQAKAAAMKKAKARAAASARRVRWILIKSHQKYLRKAEAKVRRSMIRSGSDSILRSRLQRIFFHKCGKMSYRFRRIDGSCNSWRFVKRGAAGTPFKFLSKRGRFNPSGGNRPSARVVSNIVHHDHKSVPNRRRMSEMVVFFGQFLDHTLAETENNKKQKFYIPVPKNDRFFKNVKYIEFLRTMKKKTPRGWSPINLLPSHVDLAVTYGAHKEASDVIRMFKKGLLKSGTSKLSNNMLPRDKDGFFLSGDRRVNENPSLTAMHTLFKREHNRLCEEVSKAFPKYNDEMVFQLARKINGALFQSIVYHEFLPTVLGRKLPYTGTRRFVAGRTDPTLSDEFSVMAYRVGHTLVNDHMTFIRKGGKVVKRLLKTVFFKPKWFNVYTIEDCFRGMTKTRAAEVDVQIANQLRNFLFSEEKNAKPLDLLSLNIQRGRDHRLPSYVQLRRNFKLPVPWRFDQITKNRRVQRALRKAYGRVDRIDGFSGGLAEDHVHGSSLGPLFYRIWVQEFMRLRNGDRFYYERNGGFFLSAIRRIPTLRLLVSGRLKGRTLQYILRRNTDMKPKDLRNLWFVRK